MKVGSRPQYYRIRRIVQMVRESPKSGYLPNSSDFMEEFGVSRAARWRGIWTFCVTRSVPRWSTTTPGTGSGFDEALGVFSGLNVLPNCDLFWDPRRKHRCHRLQIFSSLLL